MSSLSSCASQTQTDLRVRQSGHIYVIPCSRLDVAPPIMALSFSSTSSITCSKLYENSGLSSNKRHPNAINIKCESTESSSELPANAKKSKLAVGSPVIVVEAPRMIKTAASVPCLRVNSGLVKPGDVGRIVSRKPMDVWAVRLSIGTYLIDGKYFKPLELDP